MSKSKSTDFGSICLGWWGILTDKSIGRSRSELARLKRATDIVDVLTIWSVHELNHRLESAGHDLRQQPEKLVLIAMALSHVREHVGLRLAQQMGQGDPKRFSELRFDQLIHTQDPLQLSTQIRRSLSIIGHSTNVPRLAKDLRWWNNDIRATWCFDYYGVQAPKNVNSSEE